MVSVKRREILKDFHQFFNKVSYFWKYWYFFLQNCVFWKYTNFNFF